jgi:RHS repeat-associated protein
MDTSPGFQPFGYAGGLYDPDTKLVRFGARDYDASVGRWTCKDPSRLLDAFPGAYQYAFSDPMDLVDQTGWRPERPGAPALPPAPAGADIDANICEALRHRGNIFWFRNMVKNHAPWDYKDRFGKQYKAFGNANYGATAAALGVSDDAAQRAAGAYQVWTHKSRRQWVVPGGAIPVPLAPFSLPPPPLLLPPYGDEPVDQVNIEAGEAYFRANSARLLCDCGRAK